MLFLLLTGSIYAQHTLEAVVLDGMTRKPVANVNVYLDGTTKGTSTDAQGKFRIVVNEIINTSLVISHVGYENKIIQDPFRSLPKTIYIEERSEIIPEVTVTAKMDKRKRKEMLDVFKKHFFGNNASLCKILNEDDIILFHDEEKKELIVTTKSPLMLVNNYLKYQIRFDLIEFTIQFAENSSSSFDKQFTAFFEMNPISLHGNATFTDIGNGSKTLTNRRMNTYNLSFRNFFYLLANNRIKSDKTKNQFDTQVRLYSTDKFYDQDSIFIVNDSEDYSFMKTVIIKPEIKENSIRYTMNGMYGIKISIVSNSENNISDLSYETFRAIQVINKNLTNSFSKFSLSEITLYTDTFHIDTYGNTDLYKNHVLGGAFGRQRVGDLLPLDYMPESIHPDR